MNAVRAHGTFRQGNVTTMDNANQSLLLRRKTLWLDGDHFPFTLGRLSGYGPGVVEIDSGVPGLGVTTTEEMATERASCSDLFFEISRTSAGMVIWREVEGHKSRAPIR